MVIVLLIVVLLLVIIALLKHDYLKWLSWRSRAQKLDNHPMTVRAVSTSVKDRYYRLSSSSEEVGSKMVKIPDEDTMPLPRVGDRFKLVFMDRPYKEGWCKENNLIDSFMSIIAIPSG